MSHPGYIIDLVDGVKTAVAITFDYSVYANAAGTKELATIESIGFDTAPPPTTEPDPPPPPPPGTVIRRLGAYNGPGAARNRHWARWMGDSLNREGPGLPMISSQYIQNGGNKDALTYKAGDFAGAKEMIKLGVSPLFTITAKNTDALVRLANGEAKAVAWIEGFAAIMADIQAANPNVPVYWTFEHEYDVKTNDGTYPSTDPASNPLTYGKALQRVWQIGYDVAPRTQWGLWVGGSRRTFIGEFTDEAAKGPIPPKFIGVDPYNNEATKETPTQCWGSVLDFFRSRNSVRQTMATKASNLGWTIRYGICETGRSWYSPRAGEVRHDDASLAEFWGAVPDAMEVADVAFVVGFMRTSGPNGWQKVNIDTSHMGYTASLLGDDPSLPKRFPKAIAAYRGAQNEMKAREAEILAATA